MKIDVRWVNRVNISDCTKDDLGAIRSDILEFWESDRTLQLHHPMFVHEFGNTAFVVRKGTQVVAYLLGFISQTEPAGYIHLVAVRKGYRGQELARRLYERFTDCVRGKGCTMLKAITSPENAGSIAFHKSIGFELHGSPNSDNIPVVKDYSGKGQDRVVFRKMINNSC